tara:strand:+ start:138 stop:896 length:759 start_codon:yes stop_codon:yes gene_type:complete
MEISMEREIHKDITPNQVTRTSSEDNDTESIIDYYMQVGILKTPKEFKMGDSITTDWYNKLEDKEREKVWKDAGDAWWKAYGITRYDEFFTDEISTMEEEGDIQEYYMKKVYNKLKDEKNTIPKILKKKYAKGKKKKRKKHVLPKKRMKQVDTGILNNRGYKFGGGVELKNKITELLRETKLQPTAPFSVESDDVYGGWIRIQYDNQSGTTTEGVEELISVLRTEMMGWEYILKHEEFYWEDGAWENKYDKE